MSSKLFVFPKTIVLIFFFISVAAANSSYLKPNSNTSDRDAKSSRPRIYKDEKEKSKFEEKSVEKKSVTAFDLERRVFDLINRQRVSANLPPLKWNDELAKIARLHSENMANEKFFSHTGSDGSMVNDRADFFGVSKWRAIGENIAFNQGYDNPAEFAVECWMKSPGHRKNILDNRWNESAIGVAVTADNKFYFTEVFLLRK